MRDEEVMKKCLQLASKGKGHTSPNPLVGCMIARDGEIISEGYHRIFGYKHAEIDALDKIKGKARGASLYVNLEPCSFHGKTPPCVERIIEEGISEVVSGTKDPNPEVSGKGIEALEKNGIKVRTGIMSKECLELNQFFFKWIQTGLPYTTIKIAETSDNFVAYEDGSCPEITNMESRTEVHRLRSWYDAVLIGKGTAKLDNPSLTVRHVKGRQPLRVVLDSHFELLNQKLELLKDEHSDKTIWVVGEDVQVDSQQPVRVLKVPLNDSGHLDLRMLLSKLGEENVSSILVEGGPQIWEALLEKNLVDQVITFTSPKEFKKGIPVVPSAKLSEISFEYENSRKFDDDSMNQKFLKTYSSD